MFRLNNVAFFYLQVSYFEIYMDKIRDLLDSEYRVATGNICQSPLFSNSSFFSLFSADVFVVVE